MSKAEAAALAGVNIRTIQRWAMSGRISFQRDVRSGRPYFRRTEIESVRNGRHQSSKTGKTARSVNLA